MTIIAHASVPGAIPLSHVETFIFPRQAQPIDGCPSWCAGGDNCWRNPAGFYMDEGEVYHHGTRHEITVPGTFIGETVAMTVQVGRLDNPGQPGKPHVYLAQTGEEGWELDADQALEIAAALVAAVVELRREER